MSRRVAKRAGIVLAAVAAGYLWGRTRSAPVRVVRQEVPVERITRIERVDTVVKWRERIVWRTRKPDTVRIASTGGEEDVRRLCGRDTVVNTVVVRVPPESPGFLVRSVRAEPSWLLGKDRVLFTGPTSDGGLRQFSASVRPPWQARTLADSLLVQDSRFGILRQLIEAGAWVGAGWLLGRVFP